MVGRSKRLRRSSVCALLINPSQNDNRLAHYRCSQCPASPVHLVPCPHQSTQAEFCAGPLRQRARRLPLSVLGSVLVQRHPQHTWPHMVHHEIVAAPFPWANHNAASTRARSRFLECHPMSFVLPPLLSARAPVLLPQARYLTIKSTPAQFAPSLVCKASSPLLLLLPYRSCLTCSTTHQTTGDRRCQLVGTASAPAHRRKHRCIW